MESGIAVLLGRDKFGDAFKLHRRQHLDDAVQHIPTGTVASFLNQRSVDLHLVEPDFAQIDQRGEACAEIVQHDAAPRLAQLLDIAPGGVEIDHHRRFGNFQLQAMEGKAALLDQRDDLACGILCADMGSAQIEREAAV